LSPTIIKYKEYRFFFFSKEEERKHIHVSSHNGEVKYWLDPEIELAHNMGFSEKQLNEVKRFITKHKNEIIEAWIKHFNS
jgi:hypothetical protein